MNKFNKRYTIVELLIVIIFLIGSGGYIANIVKIINSDFAHLTGLLIIRVIGLFLVPLGAIVGYF